MPNEYPEIAIPDCVTARAVGTPALARKRKHAYLSALAETREGSVDDTSSAPTCAAAVANAFLDIEAADHSGFPAIDQLKMQKLVFYAQAWWLAYMGTELFPEDIEAWPWGPVVRSIYKDFIAFGRQPIPTTARASVISRVGDGPFDVEWEVPPPPSADVMGFLNQIWAGHKSLTGVQLSNATHLPGEPWTIVRDQIGDLGSKPRIPNSLIRDVFKAKLAAAPA